MDDPVRRAVRHLDLFGLRRLLSAGVDPNGKCNSLLGISPLHIAALAGHTNMVELLLEYGADANIQNNWGRSALHYVSRNGTTKMVQLLLDYGAYIDLQDIHGTTMLHDASKCNNKDVVALLLCNDADPNIRNEDGILPGQLAKTSEMRALFYMKEWRPWNHSKQRLVYRQAMRTLLLLAKM